MSFKITTLYYPSGWVAVAQKGLVAFVSERYEDEDDAREDVRKQVDEYVNQPRYNILDRDENKVADYLTLDEVNEWLSDKNKVFYLLEKI